MLDGALNKDADFAVAVDAVAAPPNENDRAGGAAGAADACCLAVNENILAGAVAAGEAADGAAAVNENGFTEGADCELLFGAERLAVEFPTAVLDSPSSSSSFSISFNAWL